MVIVTSHAVETAAPLRRQQRRSRFLFLLTIPICFSILSLLKQAPLDNSPDSAVIVPEKKDDAEHSESDSESCLRPRSNNRDAVVKSPMKLPIINLGMPKMGSTSLQSYLECGGYESVHWLCGGRYCGDCIEEAIQAGLPPFSSQDPKCKINNIDAYTQIDRGPENLVQVNYLHEIMAGVPSATFVLTFRNMTKWYMSMSNWWTDSKEVPFNSTKDNTMRGRFEVANITGLPVGVGRNVSEFSHFYCEYVKRVREEVAKYPGRHELIEIDIEDPTVGRQMEEAFGVNRTCWGHSNTGNHNDAVPADELQ
mmetsp:Transcript_24434/g.37383  ORF Transcript_24434/g.37383 Transcript_24434/m.37383 type:complete len:309 (-) Transcript_24434:275-1201(-)